MAKIIEVKKFFSIAYPEWAFSLAMLIMRLAAGVLMIPHGYSKLVKFESLQSQFMNFMGLGQSVSLALVVFAEFFCALFVAFGLFTRLSVIPLVIAMGVALFKAHQNDLFGDGQPAALFLSFYLAILLCGAGKYSIDGFRK